VDLDGSVLSILDVKDSQILLAVDELDAEDFGAGEGGVYGDGGRNRRSS